MLSLYMTMYMYVHMQAHLANKNHLFISELLGCSARRLTLLFCSAESRKFDVNCEVFETKQLQRNLLPVIVARERKHPSPETPKHNKFDVRST